MTGIKFCGLRTSDDIAIVNTIVPDYAGFIVTEGFTRSVGSEGVRRLSPLLNKGIKAVGVFVDDDIDTISELAESKTITVVQLHGSEDEDYIKELRKRTSAEIVKTFEVCSADDIDDANRSSADIVLLDSGKGTGRTFDWKLLEGMRRPCIIAGGLDTENVGDVIRKRHPFAVDVSSRMETDGHKDKEKMMAFADAVRRADADTE